MENIKALIKGIFGGFNIFVPVSYEGHSRMIRYLYIDMNSKGYDTLLPVIIQLAAIISLIYFLRKDIIKFFKTGFNILTKKASIKQETTEINHFFMVISAALMFIFIPVFSRLFSSMSENFMIISLSFILSGIFLYIAENAKEKKLSEKNEIPLSGVAVGIFKVISVLPGFSGLGGMYFIGILSGFTKKYALKFAYIVTLIAMLASFIKNIINMFNYILILYNVFAYILAFAGAVVTSCYAIKLTAKAVENKLIRYFGLYNIIVGIFVFLIWIRG